MTGVLGAELERGGWMYWGVKATFLDYLVRTPGVQVSVGGGAGYAQSGEFAFPITPRAEVQPDGPRRSLRCEGDVRFVGHGGLMDIVLSAPWITEDEGSTTLSFAVGGGAVGRVAVAALEWDGGGELDAESGRSAAAARLLATGTTVFGDSYPPGELMAPVRLHLDV